MRHIARPRLTDCIHSNHLTRRDLLKISAGTAITFPIQQPLAWGAALFGVSGPRPTNGNWISRNNIHIELTPACPGKRDLVVSRMIVPVEAVDQAVFVRRGFPIPGVERTDSIDGL